MIGAIEFVLYNDIFHYLFSSRNFVFIGIQNKTIFYLLKNYKIELTISCTIESFLLKFRLEYSFKKFS